MLGMTPRRPLTAWAPVPALACAIAIGCSSAAYRADADREVELILGDSRTSVLGDREQRVVRPEPEAAAPEAPHDPTVPPPATPTPVTVTTVDLTGAIAFAFRQNRDYLSRRESLYRQGLSYSLARFNFGPQFRSAVSHVWSDTESGIGSQRLAGSLGLGQILPTGGQLSLDSGLGSTWTERSLTSSTFDGLRHDAAISLNLAQPLLRGAGYSISHEALTQAERDLVYAIRDFELFRENFSITIARSFFDLVSQQQTLANEETNLRQATFDRRQSEALLQVDRSTEVEVYRAKRREIDAENRLLDARATFERARDQFKIALGMPTATAIEIASSDPPFAPVRHDPTSAIAAAKNNRLDLITEREQLDDAERAVQIAENNLLPELDLNLGVGFGADPDSSFAQSLPDRWNATASITMAVPLQQKAQRNGLRSAQIALDQARRSHAQTLDQVELEIKNQLRSLRSLEQQIELQRGQIQQEKRAVTVTEIRYEAGDLDNRDLLEARQALFNAQNALIQLSAQHFISRLTLTRDLGLLFVDDEGVWR